jgi:hypothetical protein
MSATKKNFAIVQNVLNDQAKAIRDQAERLTMLEGTVATLRAEIANTKQMAAHLHGRGMGSTVHGNGN